jgi:hypothetical protein
VQGVDATARALAGLEHHHAAARLREAPRGGQPGHAGADDHAIEVASHPSIISPVFVV